MFLGRFLRKMLLAHPKTKSSIFSGQARWIFKHHRVLWLDETKKKSFLAANTLDGFGAHKDKKYPMLTI